MKNNKLEIKKTSKFFTCNRLPSTSYLQPALLYLVVVIRLICRVVTMIILLCIMGLLGFTLIRVVRLRGRFYRDMMLLLVIN